MDVHDIHGYIAQSQRWIEEEYLQIQKRAREDPGTAGDQGETNWAELLKKWLPSYFHIQTKGRILTHTGDASPQVDVVVLVPSYPQILLEKKLYLAGGVVAAFECKTTLRAEHIRSAVKTGAELRQKLPIRKGSPYKDLTSSMIYGVLAHSHSWKDSGSSPVQNIEKALWTADTEFVRHPRECLDFICVADLAAWTLTRMNYLHPKYFKTPEMAKMYSGYAQTAYMCHAIGQERQKDYFSPLGVLLAGLFTKLAWTFSDMQNLEEYFRKVNIQGSAQGAARKWDISIYSDEVRERLLKEPMDKRNLLDEWNTIFI